VKHLPALVKTPDIWDHHRGLAEFLAIAKREANGHLFDDMRVPDRQRSSHMRYIKATLSVEP
jgi:hypothetical protein